MNTGTPHESRDVTQAVIANIEGQKSEAKWLTSTLKQLVQTTSEQEAALEQQRLDTILAR